MGYTYDDANMSSSLQMEKQGRRPTKTADKLAFGVVPGFELLGLPGIHLIPNYGSQDKAPKNPNRWTVHPTSLATIALSPKSICVPHLYIGAIIESRRLL